MFSLTLNDVLNVVRALLDIGLVWAVIFFGLRIVRNNSRTVQIFKGILFIFIVKGLAMLIGLTTINYIADMVLSWASSSWWSSFSRRSACCWRSWARPAC